jgi:RNA polymerase sigma-70 factor (ECF subfamily)
MPEDGAFRDLISRVRQGDEAAAAELVQRYEPAIRRAARVRLSDSRLRRAFDSMDICQSVFASFFIRAALGQYELDQPNRLLRLLVDMTYKKLANHTREERAAKRDYRRLRTAHNLDFPLADTQATPLQQVVAKELLQEFRKRLTAEERELADRRADGQDWAQIAARHGESSEALRKRLTRAVERIADELQLDDNIHA